MLKLTLVSDETGQDIAGRVGSISKLLGVDVEVVGPGGCRVAIAIHKPDESRIAAVQESPFSGDK